jgi:hypothetical protein
MGMVSKNEQGNTIIDGKKIKTKRGIMTLEDAARECPSDRRN